MDDVTQGDHQRFVDVKQAVYIHDNVYGEGARPYDAEQNAVVLPGSETHAAVVDEGDEAYIEVLLPQSFDNIGVAVTTGTDLEPVASSTPSSKNRTGPPRYHSSTSSGSPRRRT